VDEEGVARPRPLLPVRTHASTHKHPRKRGQPRTRTQSSTQPAQPTTHPSIHPHAHARAPDGPRQPVHPDPFPRPPHPANAHSAAFAAARPATGSGPAQVPPPALQPGVDVRGHPAAGNSAGPRPGLPPLPPAKPEEGAEVEGGRGGCRNRSLGVLELPALRKMGPDRWRGRGGLEISEGSEISRRVNVMRVSHQILITAIIPAVTEHTHARAHTHILTH
jgi:hypothetical protein